MKTIKKIGAIMLAIGIVAPTIQAAQASEVALTRPVLKTKICKPFVSDTGFSRYRNVARQKAQRNWRVKVSGRYGNAYASWGRGVAKRVSCRKDNIENGYLCRARAKPCFPNGQIVGS
ncbi:MAG: hypothetical protein AAF468_05590 [Pseudomonadota bacterium]